MVCMSPAPGSRSSVRMYMPRRRSSRRVLTLATVVRRLSGPPRSQFFTRLANSQEAHTKKMGMMV